MQPNFEFDAAILTSLAGGQSVIDLPRLAVSTEDQAKAFVQAYGFDIDNEKDAEKLWYFHRRALVFLEEKIGIKAEEIPDVLRDRKQLLDLKRLLIWASSQSPDDREFQKWSCAILRVMHVFVHAESDLFHSFSEEIQKQILTPLQDSIFTEGTTGTTYLRASAPGDQTKDQVSLVGFEIKPFKTSASTVIKLLAKPDAVAMKIFDRLGVRFVTKSMFDSFRVIQFLVDHHLVSFPHIMPDQSSNNLYPAELFGMVITDLKKQNISWTESDLEKVFKERLENSKEDVRWHRKENFFSGTDYQFIKFISRKLIRVPMGDKGGEFSFFFPYEVQIMDQASYARIQSGPSEHQKYKERQKEAARVRLFPE